MSYDHRLLVCAAASFVGHALFARGLQHLPREPDLPLPRTLEVRLIEPPPPPPPLAEPEPEPEKPPESQRPPPQPRTPVRSRTPVVAAVRDRVPQQGAPSERPATTGDATATPTFGVSMESVSQAGNGPAVPVGNTLQTRPTGPPGPAPAHVDPLAVPVAAYEVSKMPLPQGRCSGRYTDAARQAGAEGTVVLDLVVGPDGKARDIQVVQGLGYGLTEAAVSALESCRFAPGERNGKPVPVRVRGFKIRFFLQESG